MENSVIIAQLFGIVYLSVGIGMFVSGSQYDKLLRDFENNAAFVYLSGILALIFGFIILQMNSTWEASYVGAITLIGWAALVKGVLLLVKPDMILGQLGFWKSKRGLMQVFTIVLGIAFTYYGYFA